MNYETPCIQWILKDICFPLSLRCAYTGECTWNKLCTVSILVGQGMSALVWVII